ncbi:SDR family oxidoreductase [Endobacter medicaginis]|uniref:SDR family oxidoreductase n=2 Tax=Endobacter medicaginis TaxID=1181271 RepID=A0A850NUL9_9PROT|nr:SDR family oxidoreductase [Endobacter medicaginis]
MSMSAPKLFITGATGQLGRLVIDTLLDTVPPGSVVAGVRDPEGEVARSLRERGVELRLADYTRPDTLAAAFSGIDRLLLISGNEIGQRVVQHGHVIDAAKARGVKLLAYTSILRADTSPLALAEEHRATEALIRASGLPHVLLRNGWYNEVFTWRLPEALRQQVLFGAAGEGRISSAGRADYAAAAAAALVSGTETSRIHELAGDTAFSLAELAAILSRLTGESIPYRDIAPDALCDAARAGGLPQTFAEILADTDAGIARGALFDDGGALGRLIGRATTPIQDTVAGFLAAIPSAAH